MAYRWLTNGSPRQVGYVSCSECDRDPLALRLLGKVLVVDFGLLGPLTVSDGAQPVTVSAPRQRVLLATLLLSAGRVVSVDTLTEVLWDGEPPAGARGAMHSAIQRLRSALGRAGAGLIGTRPPGYVLQLGDSGFDVREFEALTARGRAAAQAGAWAQAAGLLREALGLWRGEALADVPSQVLRQREVPPLEDLRLQVLGTRIDADLALGRHGELVAELRQLVAAHPLWEHFHAQLMLGLYRSGRQGDALAAYHDVRRVLAGELGLDPGPELRLLQQQILAADPALVLGNGAAGADAPGPAAALGPAAVAAADPPSTGTLDPPAMGTLDLSATGTPGSGGWPAYEPSAEAVRSPVVPRQLPVAPRHFAGRAGALAALAGLAAEAGGADGASRAMVITVIEGTAGIGKTALAVHFAHQVAGDFPDGQLYVNLRGFDPAGAPMTPGEAVRIFLDALGVRAAQLPASLDAQAGLYRSLLAGRRMLVLLDNARDAGQVRPLLPASPGCLVLVTSRSQLTGLAAAEGAIPLALDVLTGDEARELLAARLGGDRLAAEQIALAATERLGDRAAQAFAHWQFGYARTRLGNHEDAHAHLERALSIYTELGDRAGAADAHTALGVTLEEQGRDTDALSHTRQALELFTAAGDRAGQALALNGIGWLDIKLGDYRHALVSCGQALELFQELGYSRLEADIWDSLGLAHHHLGDHAESTACYKRALGLYREIGDRYALADTLGHIGDTRLAAGRPDEARAAWEEALAILDDLHHPDAGQIRAKLAGPGADRAT